MAFNLRSSKEHLPYIIRLITFILFITPSMTPLKCSVRECCISLLLRASSQVSIHLCSSIFLWTYSQLSTGSVSIRWFLYTLSSFSDLESRDVFVQKRDQHSSCEYWFRWSLSYFTVDVDNRTIRFHQRVVHFKFVRVPLKIVVAELDDGRRTTLISSSTELSSENIFLYYLHRWSIPIFTRELEIKKRTDLRVRLRDFQSRKNIGIVWYVFTGYADFSFFVVDVETGGSNSPMQFHTILIRCTRLPSMRSAL